MSPRPQLLLVFFTSSRSGPARRMESVLAHIARKERSHVDVIRVEVGQQPELADRFGVEAIPTLVLVRDKLVVDRLAGRASAPQIERMLAAHEEEPAFTVTRPNRSPAQHVVSDSSSR